MDKTTYEIAQAVAAGKEVVCINPYNSKVYRIVDAKDTANTQIHFGSIYASTAYNLYSNIGSERWHKFSSSLQIQLSDSGASQNIKTINNESILGSGNIDINTIVWCTYTETDSVNHTGTMSMTVAELEDAVQAGNVVCLRQGDAVYTLTFKGTSPMFVCVHSTTIRRLAYFTSDQL